MPRTVDEVVDLLVSDLMNTHRDALSRMDASDFALLYRSVAEYIIAEFRLWTGNEALLNDCLAQAGSDAENLDPALVILRKVRERFNEEAGVLIIT